MATEGPEVDVPCPNECGQVCQRNKVSLNQYQQSGQMA